MVPIMSLWMPILLSSVIVFLVSAVIHMVLPYHRSDFRKLESETEIMEALRKFNLRHGDFMIPHAGSPEGMKSADFLEKMSRGPVAIMTVMRTGPPAMGSSLIQWFIYSVVVGFVAAYVAGRALGPGAPYLEVFRFAGCAAFLSYSLALAHDSIWYKRSWGTTLKFMVDGLIYGMLTGGTFGWLWPR